MSPTLSGGNTTFFGILGALAGLALALEPAIHPAAPWIHQALQAIVSVSIAGVGYHAADKTQDEG